MARWADDERDGSDRDEDARLADEATQDETPKGDAAVGAAISKASSQVLSAAAGTGRTLAGGLSAIRAVRRASKLRSNAQDDLREIERGLEEDRDLLVHREDVERNYPDIVATQTHELSEAQAEADDARAQIEACQRQRKELGDELRRMRERHEQRLRPYRNLMDSSRGRSDDAAKALANVRRSVRSAENAVSSATKRREQRISAAHRAVDNAQERLSTVQAELDALMADPDASPGALGKVQGELATEQSHLADARSDVGQVTQEAQEAVDQAQRNLWALQRELSSAEKSAEAAKEEATARKDEYDGLYKDAQAKERAQEDAIRSCETRMRDLQKTYEAAERRAGDASQVLDEAEEIHAHPETTVGLRERIANEERDLDNARNELERLFAEEREVRKSTRGARILLVVVMLLVLALVAFLVWLFVLRH